jgi:hypothetical protein
MRRAGSTALTMHSDVPVAPDRVPAPELSTRARSLWLPTIRPCDVLDVAAQTHGGIMRHLLFVFSLAFVGSVAMVSSPVRTASADGATPPAPAPAPAPAPTPAPPPPKADCATCIQCVAACGTAYADCTRKCFSLPDFASQQACVTQCPAVTACAQACPCSGCGSVPGLPH